MFLKKRIDKPTFLKSTLATSSRIANRGRHLSGFSLLGYPECRIATETAQMVGLNKSNTRIRVRFKR